jgi:hypothetical protein
MPIASKNHGPLPFLQLVPFPARAERHLEDLYHLWTAEHNALDFW